MPLPTIEPCCAGGSPPSRWPSSRLGLAMAAYEGLFAGDPSITRAAPARSRPASGDRRPQLTQHGSAYGLCQIYANEIWHFERVGAPDSTCPAPLADGSDG
jgi:hypothetical protein